MLLGVKVRSINELSGFIFVTLETDDSVEIQLRFKSDDPRAEPFLRVRSQFTIEVNPVSAMLRAIR